MRVTKLKISTRNPNRIELYLDGKFVSDLGQAIIADFGIWQDKELTSDELDNVLLADQVLYYQALSIELISRRPRSVKEIENYLLKKIKQEKFRDRAVKKIVNDLQDKDYLNDLKFAKWWLDNRKTFASKSIREIKQELLQKGVSKDISEQIFQGEVDDTSMLQELIAKKKRLLSSKDLSEKQLNQKVIEFLLRKGFKYDNFKNLI